jgi:HEAT repeat protein
VIELLQNNPRTRVKEAAAMALGTSGHRRAYPVLLEVFRKGRDTYVVEALAALGDPRAEPVLLAVLREEHAPLRAGDRLALIEALGKLGTERSVPRLIPELEHPEPVIRLTAARILGRLGDRRALEPLATCAEDFYRVVREACTEAQKRVAARNSAAAKGHESSRAQPPREGKPPGGRRPAPPAPTSRRSR